MTSLYDGLYVGLRLIDEEERPLLLLFTDGRDTSSWLTDVELLELIRESNAVVYAITTYPPFADDDPSDPNILAPNMKAGLVARPKAINALAVPGIQFLREVARRTGGSLLFAESPSQLKDAFQKALSEMKTRYLLSYIPTGVEREGWHELEVRIKKRGAKAKARPGYWMRPRSP